VIPAQRVPPGFDAVAVPAGLLVARRQQLEALRRAGLDDPSGWERRLGGPSRRAGRGATARLELPDGFVAVLKKMRRGGALAPLWRDRFPGRRRLLHNLEIPVEAAERGIATPSPAALLLVPGPRGLYRGWLALEQVAGAADLLARLASPPPPTHEELEVVMSLVRRMHDRGLEHRDLNLGNLLLRAGHDRRAEAFVIDLDGARLHAGPVGFRVRQRALRRIERSFVKQFGRRTDEPAWYELYAGADAALRERLERGRALGRLWLFLHRLGWSR
jgi:hypothetical protein